MLSAVYAALICLGMAVVPLTSEQQVQLQTAADGSQNWDEPALYPLLQNILQWEPGGDSSALHPDYLSIAMAPVDHRGRLFLIEGKFAGVPREETTKLAPLARPGPWDGRLDQWVVVTDEEQDEVAVVFVLDAPPAPRAGAAVRVHARFYKILSNVDRSSPPQPTQYLTFVGRGAEVLSADNVSGKTSPLSGLGILFPLIMLLMIGWAAARHTVRAARARSTIGATGPLEDDDDPQGATFATADLPPPADPFEQKEPLPNDPAEALRVLRQNDET